LVHYSLIFINYTKPGKWAFMYMCVRGIDFASISDLILDFGIVPTVWYILVFIVLFIIVVNEFQI